MSTPPPASRPSRPVDLIRAIRGPTSPSTLGRPLRAMTARSKTLTSVDEIVEMAIAALSDGTEPAVLPVVAAAAQSYPGEATIWQVLGLLYRALDDLSPAMAAFETAARLNPDSARIAHGHARVFMEAGLPSALVGWAKEREDSLHSPANSASFVRSGPWAPFRDDDVKRPPVPRLARLPCSSL